MITTEELYKLFTAHPSVQTDTRLLQPGDLFFALRGPNFNGNAFALAALEKGAAYSIVDDPALDNHSGKLILVHDALETLQQLAKFHRSKFTIPFLAITGSNGKTTTKELVHAVLSTSFKTYTTEGNLNNHIGIPLTLLRIQNDAEYAVIEMGANHLREIAGYCTYTMPTQGIITNCGKAHLEGFGGIEGVRKGKGELYDYLRANGGSIFIMWDYAYLREMSTGIQQQIRYGTKDAGITGTVLQSEPFLHLKINSGEDNYEIHTQLVGDYNLPNVLAAVAVGHQAGITSSQIKKAIEHYQPSNSRSQLVKKGTNQVILDAYNANPSSMKLAIENFSRLQVRDKILMLGAMAELGPQSVDEHQQIIDLIRQYSWKHVILVGGDFMKIKHPFIQFQDSLEAKQWFDARHLENTYLLIKGSRSMKMEKILE